ncbi:MAG: 4-hydroxy-tetrahydrodipicolinate reductase [Megasphaera micronuciformis]|jgi:dihydrodipicolinate reductase|nr:4-hydroxy-tetrahydrodipicolinate reductase [Megasphaera micronuciformis]
MIRVLVSGADGRMGSETVKAVLADNELEFVGGTSLMNVGKDAGEVIGISSLGLPLYGSLNEALKMAKPDVVVDFTTPAAIYGNVKTCIENGTNIVVGTTGLTAQQRNELDEAAKKADVAVFIAPNFSVGAVLMMKYSAEISKYLPDVEIIELHHNNKLDAPSGTAKMTAEKIARARREAGAEPAPDKTHESLTGARGAAVEGIPVHSVRLPGYVAHQEVLFGGYGEILTVRHDSLDRKSFMPGVVLAVKKVDSRKGVTFGLEHYL